EALACVTEAWYVLGMTKKIAISLPDATVGKARAAVRAGRAANVSNYIGKLIEEASAEESFQEMSADLLRESGATPDQIAAARVEVEEDFERAGLIPKHEKAAKKAS